MLTEKLKHEYYQALLEKNSYYEGVFFVGIKTTGIFCRPTCAARKPKFENCEFYKTAQEALLAAFRPCRRCRPLCPPYPASDLIQKLVNAVEENPEKRWKDQDFQQLSVDVSTVRRQFKKRFGMTFVQYARARRMGIAMKQIRQGEAVIEAQLNTGYESGSGFRDAFAKIMGAAPVHFATKNSHLCPLVLKASWLDTPLGPMLAIADDKALYLLEFIDRRGLEREIEKLRLTTKAAIIPGANEIIALITQELVAYFNGKLRIFQTPFHLLGTSFQKQVWLELIKIPYGQTRSYLQQAIQLKQPTACRAVANANGVNQLALLIPCHRIINNNGELGGYGGGIARKKWLLEHEKNTKDIS